MHNAPPICRPLPREALRPLTSLLHSSCTAQVMGRQREMRKLQMENQIKGILFSIKFMNRNEATERSGRERGDSRSRLVSSGGTN